jgi:hypothetical protein
MTKTLEKSKGSASRPGRSLSSGKTRYPLYRRLGGPQGRSEEVRKDSPPPEVDNPTVQLVASLYTNCAILPTMWNRGLEEFCNKTIFLRSEVSNLLRANLFYLVLISQN